MNVDIRKIFIGNILVGLIEKTPDVKVMKAVTRIVGEWVKTKPTAAVNQTPSLREKSILLVKLMQYVEKRFSMDEELMGQFLTLVLYVYKDEQLKTSELVTKLENAFLSGLRCTQPTIRASFLQVFQDSMPNRLHSRLLYIVCSQNWENIGPHYWIKQCLQILLSTAHDRIPIQVSRSDIMLPSVTSVIGWAEPTDRALFTMLANIKEEDVDQTTTAGNADSNQEDIDMELSSAVPAESSLSSGKNSTNSKAKVLSLISTQWKFYQGANEVYTSHFLAGTAQLCHMDTGLAEWVWKQLFPRVWAILSEKQQQSLAREIPPFLASGSHIIQKECHPSALQTFVESLCLCQPSVPLRPFLLEYLGKGHNLWHRMCLQLETLAHSSSAIPNTSLKREADFSDPIMSLQQEALMGLHNLYTLMKEEDLWAGLWQTHAYFPETKLAVSFEQHGFMEQAVAAYEVAMTKGSSEIAVRPLHPRHNPELKLWEDHWIRCTKELNQWEMVRDFGAEPANGSPQLVLDGAWRVPDWPAMKEALATMERASYPREYQWKVNLYKGYLAICLNEEHQNATVDKIVELTTALCIREWKRLPTIVSHIHLPFLQAAQQVMELQEAYQIHQGLVQGRNNSLHDMKAIVKTWRNRLPVIADDLSHWSDIFSWRQQHYQFIVNHYTDSGEIAQVCLFPWARAKRLMVFDFEGQYSFSATVVSLI